MWTGMNAAVRAIVRMGIYVGCRVYLVKEVGMNGRLLKGEFKVEVIMA